MKRKPSKREDGMPDYFYGTKRGMRKIVTAQQYAEVMRRLNDYIVDLALYGVRLSRQPAHFYGKGIPDLLRNRRPFTYLGKQYVLVDHKGEK